MEQISTTIADYLINQSWQLVAVFALVAAACWGLRKRSAHWRYLLWLVVLAKCLVPGLIDIPLPVLKATAESEHATTSSHDMIPAEHLPMPAPVATVHAEIGLKERPVRAVPAMSAEQMVLTSRGVASPKPITAPSLNVSNWLAIVWFVGAGLFLTYISMKASSTQRRLSQTRRLADEMIRTTVAILAKRLGMKSIPKVYMVDGVAQPFVWGWIRGSIYLPEQFIGTDTSEHQRDVLAHEMAHITRWDAAMNVVQILVQAAFFFHPLVWWANRQVRREREKCCDEVVMACLKADPRQYSQAIVNALVAEYKMSQSPPALAVAGRLRNIEERIEAILSPHRSFYRRPSWIAVAAVVFVATCAIPTSFVFTVYGKSPQPVQDETSSRPEATSRSEAASDQTVKVPEFGDGFSSLQLPQPTDKPAVLTFDQLRNGVRQYYGKIDAIEVKYEHIPDTGGPRSIHHFAFKGDKRFKSQAFPPHNNPAGPLSIELTMAFDGEVERSYRTPVKHGQVEKKQDFIDLDAYVGEALAISLENAKPGRASWQLSMPSALNRRESDWKVNPRLEVVDGRECYVLESKKQDRIWVDPGIGYATRFRERRLDDTHRPPEQRPLLLGYYLGNYRQVADGVWLPQLVKLVCYTTPKPPDNQWKRAGTSTLSKVTTLAVNEQVADSLFQLSFPPGTQVTDTINNRFYIVGADGKPHSEQPAFEQPPSDQSDMKGRKTLKRAQTPPAKRSGVAIPAMGQSANNLKQIMLALLNYEAAQRKFPPAYTTGKDGKPLLSWRVFLLPYLGESILYKRFRLDEPWDSRHNRQLIAAMPLVYRQPTGSADNGKTNYLTVRSEKSLFPGGNGVSASEIIDGLATTIAVVEANDDFAVIWTKPDDLEYDNADPAKGLGGLWSNQFLVGFADGSAQFLKASVNPTVLAALFTRNGREPVNLRDAMPARDGTN